MARNIQANEDDTADAPADILTKFTERHSIALSCERQQGLSKAGVLLGKDLAEFRQAFQGIRPTSMTIGPVIITEDTNERMFERLEQPMPLREKRIYAGA